jgi:DNA-directed RNA polymerase subunit RPC12/RpoP
MNGLILTCDACGHEMRVTELAIGSRGRCAECGAVVTVSYRNTRPLEDEILAPPRKAEGDDPDLREPVSEPVPAEHQGPGCARCGQQFRGDWDRYQRDEGVVCHRCANRTDDVAPDPAALFERPPTISINDLPFELPEEKAPAPEVPTFAKGHPELFRAALWTAAILIMGLAFIMSWMPEQELTFEEMKQIEADASQTAYKALPVYALGIIWLFQCVFVLGQYMVALIVTLRIDRHDNTPIDLAYVLEVLPNALLLSLASFFPFFMAGAIPLLSLLLALLHSIMLLYVFWGRLDIGCGTFLMYLFIIGPLVATLSWAANIVLLGLAGMIFL